MTGAKKQPEEKEEEEQEEEEEEEEEEQEEEEEEEQKESPTEKQLQLLAAKKELIALERQLEDKRAANKMKELQAQKECEQMAWMRWRLHQLCLVSLLIPLLGTLLVPL